MQLTDIAMIVADTARTKAYIQAITQNELCPGFVLIMRNRNVQILPGQQSKDASTKGSAVNMGTFLFDKSESLEETLNKFQIPFAYIDSIDINSEEVIKSIIQRPESVFIYSGFGGVILRSQVLNSGKKFLHIHGGYLPDYKGSTTNYYSLLKDNECGASSIFMDKEIDCGPVLIRRKFPPPENRGEIDYIYDSAIRAKVLIETLQEYVKEGRWMFELSDNIGGETYLIIHPVLKHIAILAEC